MVDGSGGTERKVRRLCYSMEKKVARALLFTRFFLFFSFSFFFLFF
jgi:hypothetical protein